jgi:outer membrane immunogenic protein
MRHPVLAAAGILALSVIGGAAAAADLPGRPYGQPAPAYRAPGYAALFTWTGFYIGLNGGGAWGRSRWDGLDTFDVSGALIGATAGYNFQTGRAVFGVEGDIDWSGLKGDANPVVCAGCSTKNNWLATARVRLGYAFDRFLPYLTAGLALGNVKANLPFLVGISQTNAGWTVGAGIEFGITNNVSVKAEYLYVDLGEVTCGLNCALAPTGEVSLYANVLRAGVNWRF